MPATTPRIELLPGQPGPADFDADTGFNHAPVAPPKYRWRIFSLTLLVSLVAGLLFTWWRPPLYQSSAMLALSAHLHPVFRPLGVLRLLPVRVQDWLYARIARNRYALFGRDDLCAMPDPDLRRRLVE